MVGVGGFEPPTSRSRTVHSTKLSHTPNCSGLYHTTQPSPSRLHPGWKTGGCLPILPERICTA